MVEGLSMKIRPKFDPGNHIFKVGKLHLLVNKHLLTLRAQSFNTMKISNVSFILSSDTLTRITDSM